MGKTDCWLAAGFCGTYTLVNIWAQHYWVAALFALLTTIFIISARSLKDNSKEEHDMALRTKRKLSETKEIPAKVRQRGLEVFESPMEFTVWYYSHSKRLSDKAPFEFSDEEVLELLEKIATNTYWDPYNPPYSLRNN